jgi:hypothetical protein
VASKHRRFAKLPVLIWLAMLAVLAGCQAQPTPVPVPVDHLINFGQTVTGQLADHENRWVFVGTSDSIISVEFSNVEQNTPTVAIINPNGDSVARVPAGIGRLDRFRLLVTGQYAIVVGSGSGEYTLSLTLIDAGQHTPTVTPTPTLAPITRNVISYDEQRTGTLKTGDAQDLWSFIGHQKRVITIRLLRVSGEIDPVLHLFAPDGASVAHDDNNGGGRNAMIAGIELPVTGTYLIQVSGNGRIGDYELAVQSGAPIPTTTPTATPIPPTAGPTLRPSVTPTVIENVNSGAQIRIGQTIQAEILKPDQIDRFIVFGPAGSTISLGMFAAQDSALVPAFEVFAPDGNQVLAQAGPKGAITRGFTLSATGAYIIYAHSNNSRTTGGYTLTVGDGLTLRDLDGGPLVPDGVFPGILSRTGDREIWSIDLPANATISVEVLPDQSNLTPMFDVIGPDNTILGAIRGNARGARANGLLTSLPGKYQVRVNSADANFGDYIIKLRVLSIQPTPTFSISIDETVPIQVQQGERFTYSFKAIPGEVVLINATAHNPLIFDPVIELYGPSGRRLAIADDINVNDTNAAIQIPLDDGIGAYTVQVYGYAMMPGTCILHIKTG